MSSDPDAGGQVGGQGSAQIPASSTRTADNASKKPLTGESTTPLPLDSTPMSTPFGSSAVAASATSNDGGLNNAGTMSTSTSASSSATAVPKPAGKKSNVGPIVGGVVGGIVVIALIIAIIFLVRRRKQKKRRIETEKAATAVPTKGSGSYSESPTNQPSYQPPKAFDPAVAAPISRKEVPVKSATEPKSLAPPPATTSHHEVHMPMSREVNEDGVSLRSASPDLTDVADRHSFVEESGTPTVPRLPRQDREKGGHGSAL